MKSIFKWLGLTSASLCISLTAASIAANSQPSPFSDSRPSVNLLTQYRRLPGRGGFGGQQMIRVPIEERAGGIPVVAVTFNGNRRFPMLLDTGASITTITPEMARALRFRQEDTISVQVASGQTHKIPVGRVSSIEVGGYVIDNFEVAVAATPLLGQNFYSRFNMTIRENFVFFRPKRR
jgi:predicted aspartyl protease